MHFLKRPAAPVCLLRFQHGRDNWNDIKQADRREIWQQLNLMQGQLCAYCENDINGASKTRHIEHFRQRGRYPQGTFDWSNLFGSCMRKESCGHHKDDCKYHHADLIKPDHDDPEMFLQFLSDGRIVPRIGLSANDLHKAQETLRVFNLDHDRGPLRQMRKRALIMYKRNFEEIQELSEFCDPIELKAYMQSEIDAIADQPFKTAIKHYLTGV